MLVRLAIALLWLAVEEDTDDCCDDTDRII